MLGTINVLLTNETKKNLCAFTGSISQSKKCQCSLRKTYQSFRRWPPSVLLIADWLYHVPTRSRRSCTICPLNICYLQFIFCGGSVRVRCHDHDYLRQDIWRFLELPIVDYSDVGMCITLSLPRESGSLCISFKILLAYHFFLHSKASCSRNYITRAPGCKPIAFRDICSHR